MATKPSSDDEAKPCTDLTAFQIDALAEIARLGRPHGLAIKDGLENRYGTVHHGRLYPNLDTLVVKGLVEKGQRDKRTNYYTLTGKGSRELRGYQSWLAGCMSNGENEGKELVTDGGVVAEQQQQQPSIEEAHAVDHARQTDNYHRIMMLVGSFGGAVIGMIPIVAHLGGAMTFEVAALFQIGFIAMCVSMGLSGVMLNE